MKEQKQETQIDPQALLKEMKNEMSQAVEKLSEELKKIKTGRAHPSLLDGIRVFAYDSELPLNQVALITLESSTSLLIQPYDSSTIPAIEKAILQSGRDLVPSNDGKNIRIKIPPLTQETREKIIKMVRKKSEDFKVSIRNTRDKVRSKIREMKNISEDRKRKILEDIEKETNEFISKIDKLTESKEKEISS
ncbi:MAG: ribosome recycling factor [Candidatus Calescibacterium sp.]|nr:ribosome recycling factor [Candidatus Calescibacterium sp.]MCX7733957.1 ribosome recycling factor [bacterium]MDW8086444.1 ribosome recycling factor [Candidatus Calescibacterium sp.]